jgi:DNA-binding SARP family transcriptional activator
VVLVSEGVLRPVGSRSLRTLLAVLGLRVGEAVNVDQLMDALWAERPPATGVNTLQRHMSSLRAELPAGVTLAVQAPGYRLGAAASAEVTDVQAAERLIKQARSAARPVDRAAALRHALDLWRGEPLADVAPSEYVAGHAARLAMMRAQARADLARARLELGDSADVVPDLTDLTTAEPYDEDLHGLLMLALYRSGRQAEALAVSRRLRETLADHLGIDPGEAIQSLETRILRQDPHLLGGSPRESSSVPTIAALLPETPVPAQLPASVAGFTGRRRELAELDTRLDFDEPGGAVVISAVSGTAGIGKTALAVEWAHRVADRYPDGQLYANLRGFDSQRSPVEPSVVLRGFLEGLGVATSRIPDNLDAQSALLRSLLAHRRVLLMLDNARDAEQVRPLLPGSSRCLAIVTSRNRLGSLAALEGARLVPLDLLGEAEARELVAAGWAATESRPTPPPSTRSLTGAAGCRWRWQWSPAAPRPGPTCRSHPWSPNWPGPRAGSTRSAARTTPPTCAPSSCALMTHSRRVRPRCSGRSGFIQGPICRPPRRSVCPGSSRPPARRPCPSWWRAAW